MQGGWGAERSLGRGDSSIENPAQEHLPAKHRRAHMEREQAVVLGCKVGWTQVAKVHQQHSPFSPQEREELSPKLESGSWFTAGLI